MNTQEAIDLASINGITVSTDYEQRTHTGGMWVKVISFRVGSYVVSRELNWKDWLIVGVSPRKVKRGEAIAECVRMILEARQDKCE